MIYIRADANKTIATGHIMRCCAIAMAIRSLGMEVAFITADREAQMLLEDKGFPFYCLDTDWANKEGELDILINFTKKHHVKCLLVDSYQVTEKYLYELHKLTKLAYIDDINKFIYPVNMLINYGPNYNLFNYEQSYKGTKTKLLLGTEYVPLRTEFTKVCPILREQVFNIFITTGGTDSYNMAGELLKYFLDESWSKALNYFVISGKKNIHFGCLKEIEEKHDNVTIYENPPNMAELMLKCDIAVSAAGTTMYELCACGVPTVSFICADNQKGGADVLNKIGAIECAGDVRTDKKQLIVTIGKHMEQLCKDKYFRKKRVEAMNKIVDGKGAVRIARALIEESEKQ